MQGNWNNKQAYYRCRFPAEYALANRIDHPKIVYLREAEILQQVDDWLLQAFTSAQLQATIDALTAQGTDPHDTETAAIRNLIADCDRKLAQYKAVLDAGGDPTQVIQWINDTQADRARAEGRLRTLGTSRHMNEKEITMLVQQLGDLATAVTDADPADKGKVYTELGLRLTYRPQKQLIEATVIAGPDMCKRFVSEGGLEPPCPVKGTSTSS